MKHPNNILLPFFAYGIFKPGQLCYSRISNFVESYTKDTVSGILKERDGIPLLVLGDNYDIKGYLIHFFAGKEGNAYDQIIGIEPDEVYCWSTVKVNDCEVNVLIGRKEQKGSTDLEHFDEWDGKSDPYFNQGLEEVEAILNANFNSEDQYKTLFRLQMAYMLLWSAIERYAGLKYHLGTKACKKVFKIASEERFKDTLKEIVQNKREVFNTTDLEKYTLDPNDPEKSIKYYYQVRSNVIHRGKSVNADFTTIKSSLTELLFIFKELLKESFRE
ncbi:hypothetical protein [Methylobacter sp. S3L5C]|uniref:hypothetical protein n=1 Tax=Methylobacter sp. S3L5C TaxID=2839024 RepID=UPI001FAD06DA|nr:hypothetical protein [Methylobacter sp. S3L5C]UOA08384.1 hypothetical protein KKZ03_19620 [Methylobacter sp. S3L5C]